MACWQAALIALALTACDSPPPSAVDLPGVAYVHPKRRSEVDVQRASEAFYAKETHGQDVVFRSVESEHAGYYFYTKFAFEPPVDARVVLEVVRRPRRPNVMSSRRRFVRNFRSVNMSSA